MNSKILKSMVYNCIRQWFENFEICIHNKQQLLKFGLNLY